MIREKFSFLTSEDLSLSKSGDAEQTFSSSSSALLFFSFSVTNLSPVPFFFLSLPLHLLFVVACLHLLILPLI